ncbi:MAG TPA: AprI/Inh family metalloprotease inhibitor [Pseudolabrys sp.]|nr:AprI/Inh family metalloprotease inhibitor [Pseudolabrys sp.]
MPIRTAALFCLLIAASAASAQAPAPQAPTLQAPTPPSAQTSGNDSAAKLLNGPWEFANAERDKTCTITFKTDRMPNGFKLEFDPNCASQFPFVKDIEAWTYPDNDLLRFVDAHNKPLVEFSEVETGIYEAPTPGVGVLFLQAANSSAPDQPQQTAEQMVGDWTMMRSDKPLCVFTLANTPARNGLALTVKPGCAGSIVQLGFVSWQMENGELVLQSGGKTVWRFEEGEGIWRRVPDGANPITMVRQ